MAKVTYRAPEGDDPFVMMAGIGFQDGIPVEVSNLAAVNLFKGNRYFDVADIEIEAVAWVNPEFTGVPTIEASADPIKRPVGRPRKVEL
jgi:hypothetical protein